MNTSLHLVTKRVRQRHSAIDKNADRVSEPIRLLIDRKILPLGWLAGICWLHYSFATHIADARELYVC